MDKQPAITVTRRHAGMELARFLAEQLACSQRAARRLLDERRVFVNRRRVWMARHRLQAGDVVEVTAAAASAARRGASAGSPVLRVLWDEGDYVVVDKPAGWLSNGPDSVESLARQQLGAAALQAVHRLDRETSGCLCLARTAAAFAGAVEWFRRGAVTKTYEVLVHGAVAEARQTIRKPLEGRTAVSHVERLDAHPLASHLRVRLETGRTHQIRKHLALIGHPVLGDKTYGPQRVDDERLRRVPRQLLHARAFAAPLAGGETVQRVQAPLPDDFKRVQRLMRLK
jgi:23S rRNA pseudouridine1911/1915/1917 synthase